jgi:hypothetical protein
MNVSIFFLFQQILKILIIVKIKSPNIKKEKTKKKYLQISTQKLMFVFIIHKKPRWDLFGR